MDNRYVCTVGFESEKLDKDGNPKIKKSKFLVEGVTLFDAMNSMMEYLKIDSRGWHIHSISETKFEDIVGQKEKATVYKIK